MIKVSTGQELSEIEMYRGLNYFHRVMAVWELAFVRHSEGQMTPSQWNAWDRSFVIDLVPIMTPEMWALNSVGYGEDFVKHIDSHMAEKESLTTGDE